MGASMWDGLNPNLLPEFINLRAMIALQRQTPTAEFPLIFMEEHDVMFVVRTWPDGSITCYTMTPPEDSRGGHQV